MIEREVEDVIGALAIDLLAARLEYNLRGGACLSLRRARVAARHSAKDFLMEPRHVEAELLEHPAGGLHERDRSTKVYTSALQVGNQLGQKFWGDPPSRTGPAAPLADLTAYELATETGEIALHQLQLVSEDQIIWRSREMKELDVGVGCRVAHPTRHCHDGSYAAPAREEEVGAGIVGDAGEG